MCCILPFSYTTLIIVLRHEPEDSNGMLHEHEYRKITVNEWAKSQGPSNVEGNYDDTDSLRYASCSDFNPYRVLRFSNVTNGGITHHFNDHGVC